MIPALTLTEPWASLVASGDKSIETRSWKTEYRGPIAIHAAKTFPGYAREFANEKAVRTMLERAGYSYAFDARGWRVTGLPFGCVVATAQLVAVVSTGLLDLSKLGKDRILGDFSPGRYAWYFRDVVKLAEPVPARGALQLWQWDNEAAGVEVLATGRLF